MSGVILGGNVEGTSKGSRDQSTPRRDEATLKPVERHAEKRVVKVNPQSRVHEENLVSVPITH